MKNKAILRNSVLFDENGEEFDKDAPYFSDLEEVKRWLEENKITVKSLTEDNS